MCVCIYIYTHTYVYIYIHTHIHVGGGKLAQLRDGVSLGLFFAGKSLFLNPKVASHSIKL